MLPPKTLEVINYLQESGVDPVLYGSQGVSLYIGQFKPFGDIDLLVEAKWIEKDWNALISIMGGLGYALANLHEHEFSDGKGTTVAFASIDILIRDKIVKSVSDAIQEIEVEGKMVRTLTPEAFLGAYSFSVKDGYRQEVRGKKDAEVIALLKGFLQTERPQP